jgi:hypothetical protein
MKKHTVYYNLRDALVREGCPVCHIVLRGVAHYLDGLLYESVNDPGVRKALREARGFCNEHAWQLREIGGALGIAIIHRDVIETVMASIRRGRYRPTWSLPLQRLQGALRGDQPAVATADLVTVLEPQEECPACRQRRIMEDDYLNTLLQHLDDEGLAPALRTSAGLCLPHFRRALQLVRDEETFRRVVEWQLDCLERLHGELDELIRKHDYRFVGESFGTEGDAWIRAITQVSGEKGVR